MTPQIAAAICWLGIFGLIYLEWKTNPKPSMAVWLPVIWVALGASRPLTIWLGSGNIGVSAEQYVDGSPVDAAVFAGMLLIGILVLLGRQRQTMAFLRANPWFVLFFVYCLVSVSWSDFPLVSFKRWTKVLGNITMVLLVLTDSDPAAAIKRLFARAGFLLIPTSVLLIRYYPALGRGYNRFTWTAFFCGVATDKNSLGAICLIVGIGAFWSFLQEYHDRVSPARMKRLIPHCILLLMILWLLQIANSSTSKACFGLGVALTLLANRYGSRRPAVIHRVVGVIACVGVLAYAFPDVWDSIVEALGRQPDLSGRTDIWTDLLAVHLNPLIGTGFESFWMGPRLDYFWSKYIFHPNQAHNGYLEMYLNLGWIGVSLLAILIVVGYRNAINACRRQVPWASLSITLLIISVIYNMTEAAFKVMQPVYIAFLLSVVAAPYLQKVRSAVRAAGRDCSRYSLPLRGGVPGLSLKGD